MKTRLILDTNVILDLLVFKDPATAIIWLALDTKVVDAVRTKASMLELVDVIRRPIFKLKQGDQELIIRAWENNSRLLHDTVIERAPFICRDPDDQVFIDMAYSIRPALLLSKDLRVLELHAKAKHYGIEISNQYGYLQTLLG